MRVSMIKRTVMASALAALTAVAGMTGQAQAMQFNAGDAVLVIYGNGTEYYQNLGSEALMLSNGTTNVSINQSIMSQLGGGSTIKYAVFGGNAANFGALPTDTFQGSAIPSTNTSVLSGWTNTRNGSIDQGQLWNTLVNWAGQLGTVAGTSEVLSASDARSFSSFFGTSDRLNGAFPLRMSANIESALFLLGRSFSPVGTQVPQTALGQAVLNLIAGTGEGQFSFTAAAPVPVPAAVVLFGSGLIGLVGLARRRMAV